MRTSTHGLYGQLVGDSDNTGDIARQLLREAALNLLRRSGVRQISARLRHHRQHPAAAVAVLVAPPPVDA
jgi:hypothetical protein